MIFLKEVSVNLSKLDQDILNNRGNVAFLDDIISQAKEFRVKLDWQMNKFLTDHVKGVNGVESLNKLDTSDPVYRYYNFKIRQYGDVERIIRVAEAYKK